MVYSYYFHHASDLHVRSHEYMRCLSHTVTHPREKYIYLKIDTHTHPPVRTTRYTLSTHSLWQSGQMNFDTLTRGSRPLPPHTLSTRNAADQTRQVNTAPVASKEEVGAHINRWKNAGIAGSSLCGYTLRLTYGSVWSTLICLMQFLT